ncbi:MAG: OmpA family protein [Spirochaetales bacterium]|nr:OmpA family protein [Spirochaetales bacterium]
MKKHRSHSLGLILFTVAFALSTPWAMAQTVLNSLTSPAIASAGGEAVSTDTPLAERYNPALAAENQQLTWEGNYFGIPDFGGNYGNAVNLGVDIPTRWAVFSAAGSYINLKNNSFDLGQTGRLTLAASKEIWDGTSLGLGLDSSLGTSAWGLGLSVGLYQHLGQVGPFSNVSWGASLLNMGKGDTLVQNSTVPPPFTPLFGAVGTIFNQNGLHWQVQADLGFPAVQDAYVDLGTSIEFQHLLSLNLRTAYDVNEITSGIAPAIPLSLGLSFHFATNFGSAHEVNVDSAAVGLPGGSWAFGAGFRAPLGTRDTTPPVVTVDKKTWYISPNNDGIQDELNLPVSITDDRYVMGYTLTVTDPSGKVIRSIQNKETPPPAPNWNGFWKRVFYMQKGVAVPPTLVWNGMTDAGQVAPEGTYKLAITAWDDNNNRKTYNAGTVVVLLTPPQAVASPQYTQFNPLGPRNSLVINQSGSLEDLWTGTFYDASNHPVRHFQWKDSSPEQVVWDGKNDAGTLVPDGVYHYVLDGADRAGNRTQVPIDNLIVNSIQTPASLNLDRSAFAPLGNGVKTLVFEPQPQVTEGMTDWTLAVQDPQGQTVRTLQGPGTVPSAITFDGRNDTGSPLPEGTYKGVLTLNYANGNQPVAVSSPFQIINTPPVATVTVAQPVFSPGSADARRVVTFQQTSSQEELWTGNLKNSQGKIIRTLSWPGKADATYLWDGRGADGAIQPDGVYTYQISSTDAAGNIGTSAPVQVVIDTQKRGVLLSTSRSAFSPVLPGKEGLIQFLPQFKGASALVSWTLAVHNSAGQTVKTFQGNSAINSLDWNGQADGTRLPDGAYTAELKALYQNGSHPTAISNTFLIKTTAPTASVTPEWMIFSPTPGSTHPAWEARQTTSNEPEWHAQMLNASGTPVRNWLWKGQPPRLVWDGTDQNGNKVPDGEYTYRLSSTDEAGNTGTAEITGIRLDSRPTPLFLTVDSDGFSPNGDGINDTIGFNAVVGLNEGISSWTLKMVNETLGVQKTFEGKGAVPSHFTWDGKTDQNERAANGRYTAELEVHYEKGNDPKTKSTIFALQATAPELSIGLSPLPFSPDNDGYHDELHIALGVKTYAPVDTWNLEILDPEGHHFTSFAGKGMPTGKLTWDGRSDTGELVQSASDYKLVFSLKDIWGNSATVSKTLPVDVLVLKDGDKLRIIIPSIHFARNKADFLNLDADTLAKNPDAVAKNIAVLKRLAEIFTKYGHYKIVIEGHAVMTHWDDPAAGKIEQERELIPLSKARAEAVKSYLEQLGIDGSRISTVGAGADNPIVPFSDIGNRWKDRNVQFFLIRS